MAVAERMELTIGEGIGNGYGNKCHCGSNVTRIMVMLCASAEWGSSITRIKDH